MRFTRTFSFFLLCLSISVCSNLSAKVLFIVGPSGVGKTTCIQRLLETSPSPVHRAISHTTRAPRDGEQDGIDYHFISLDQFQEMKANDEFLISTHEFGLAYGLAKSEIELDSGSNGTILKDIGGQVIEAVKGKLGSDCFAVFLAPPSYQALWERLQKRASQSGESEEQIQQRLEDALRVLSYEACCDLTIVARTIDETVDRLQEVIAFLETGDKSHLKNARFKAVPEKKQRKYDTPEIIRFHFTELGLQELRERFHDEPLNSIILELYDFVPESLDTRVQQEFPHLVTWDEEKRFLIQPTPVYGKVELLNSQNLPFLKFSENGVHLELWVIHPALLNHSFLQDHWFTCETAHPLQSATFREIETQESPYLVTLLDLGQQHLPLLHAMKQRTLENLALYQVGEQDDIQMFFHFPYAPRTASLHLHVRANQSVHPLEEAKSISLDRVIEGLEEGLSIESLVLEHQDRYEGYIYSDKATRVLPEQVEEITCEECANPFCSWMGDGGE